MKTKDDPALVEVWEMREALQEAFRKSGYDNFIDFIKDQAKEIRKKHNIKYRKETKEQIDTAY